MILGCTLPEYKPRAYEYMVVFGRPVVESTGYYGVFWLRGRYKYGKYSHNMRLVVVSYYTVYTGQNDYLNRSRGNNYFYWEKCVVLVFSKIKSLSLVTTEAGFI